MSKTITSPWSRSIMVTSSSPVTGGMRVWHLRDMVRALDEADIDDDQQVTCEHSHETKHLVRLRIRQVETQPEGVDEHE